ncbi:threonine/serine exporter family protein [Leekyejoonella antrihumi]|uniref:Threonine/serine exporter family protein n=1 Tax=Leekyejoonella antrihumi TaxID=1660198 RepID=A0A563DYD2_9MICO|nr:threonine/serine exporter family protein [Leekyejoonella antrihumi]TWP34981.1 threonine/serine exporter family protein [Leekyejoonella antrihumi]
MSSPPPAARGLTTPPADIDPRRHLLLSIGAALLSGGLPAGDVEDELCGLGPAIGAPDVRVAAWSTGLFLSMSRDDGAVFEPAGQMLRFEQTSDILKLVNRIRTRRLGVDGALRELTEIREERPRWPGWVADLGGLAVGLGLCLLLQPGVGNLVFAAVGSLVVALLTTLVRRWRTLRPLLPVASSFLVSLIVLGAFHAGWLDGPLRTIVAVLAILLPGSALVTGLTEIASGAAAAGTSRLVSGIVQLALFIVGLVGAAAVTGTHLSALSDVQVVHHGWWAPCLGVALATLGLIINVYSPPEHTLSIVAVVVVASAVQITLNITHGAAIGGLAGAVAAAVAATLVSWIPGGPAWRITYVPAFLIVAPGSFGLLNASQIEVGTGAAASLLTALSAVFGIAIGTLIGAVICRASDRATRALPLPEQTTDWSAGP